MVERMKEPVLYEDQPSNCPKENCNGRVFLPHEDGWQCFNCMKIIYKDKSNNRNIPVVTRYKHEIDHMNRG